jgi:hypothetical protein
MQSRRVFLKVSGAFAALMTPLLGCAKKSSSHRPPPSHPPSPRPAAPPPPKPAPGPGQGPPAHAPAHGRRRKYRYHYYPDSGVYFDIDRKVYFYLHGSTWKSSATLPVGIKLGATAAVTIDMDHDRPYVEFHAHKGKYPGKKGHVPPGQAKKGGLPPGKAKKGGPPPGKGKGKKK